MGAASITVTSPQAVVSGQPNQCTATTGSSPTTCSFSNPGTGDVQVVFAFTGDQGGGLGLSFAAHLKITSRTSQTSNEVSVLLYAAVAGAAYSFSTVMAWSWWRGRNQAQDVLQDEMWMRAINRAIEMGDIEMLEAITRQQEQQHHQLLLTRWTGLQDEHLARLPRTLLKEPLMDKDGSVQQCSICLCDLEAGETVIRLPCKPQHAFHDGCILPWLKNNAVCPVCKEDLVAAMGLDREQLRRAQQRRVNEASRQNNGEGSGGGSNPTPRILMGHPLSL